jgi:hypothetical protein
MPRARFIGSPYRDRYVYIIQEVGYPFCKIGIAHDATVRFNSIQGHIFRALKLIAYWKAPDQRAAADVERLAMARLRDVALGREWFAVFPERALEEVEMAAVELNIRLEESFIDGQVAGSKFTKRSAQDYLQEKQ